VLLLNSCATYEAQYSEKTNQIEATKGEIIHTFYLIGDAGNSEIGVKSKGLIGFEESLSMASKNSTALFLGGNIYPDGMPSKKGEQRGFAEHQLDMQTEILKNYSGNAIFIPGNHDWYSNGPKGLKRQQDYIEDKLGKNSFLPKNGCPIRKVDINDKIVMIIIDSEWYFTKWDKHPTINDECEFRTRAKFFDEFESLVKKARGKTTIVALHHPMFSNGPYGGQYSFAQHMTPLPVLGTLKNVIRKTSGVSNTDVQHKRYDELSDRIITLSQENDKIIFVSGHEHSLQYLVQDDIPQIISGSGSQTDPTRNVGVGKFSYGTQGHAQLDIYTDGSSKVKFYSAEEGKVVYETPVFKEDIVEIPDFATDFPDEKKASVYSSEETDRSGFFKWFWGDRYRSEFGIEVMAPTVDLDTLFGGLTPVRKGGGHQSNSLRFENSEGQEYIMRALRKNGVQYLQSIAFKEQYIREEFTGTKTEDLVMDFFTASHPYVPFTIGSLSDAIEVYHTNPELYYVPKQNAIGRFNDEYGDALYMIEERAADGHGDQASFGFSDELISTHDLLEKLRKNENHVVDEEVFIRARLFDMLIGDWDRHHDQWRWAVNKMKGKTVYKAVPRDRDQAFSLMDDGFITGLATLLIPPLRIINSYEADLKSAKWFNTEPYPLDVALIKKSGKEVWDAQVKRITSGITDEVIDEAFALFPKEVNKEKIGEIKRKLQGRRANLQKISDAYYNVINKYVIIKGTDKDDWFDIVRMPNGITKVTGYRIKNGEKADIIHNRTYSQDNTKEIWIYGLDDKDYFNVHGTGDTFIKLRLIGGLNNDSYNVINGHKTHTYDFKSKPNTLITKKGKQHLRDDYELNNYDYKKPKFNSNTLIPIIGSNPDDGFRIGFRNAYTVNGFERNPFTAKHIVGASYYSATNGFDLSYLGEFANVVGGWNLAFEAMATSPNYSINFFGYGNSTPNLNADDSANYDKDFNRVKLGTLGVSGALVWYGENNGEFHIGLNYESINLKNIEDRFINLVPSTIVGQGETNSFIGVEAHYLFHHNDNPAFPTLGMQAELETGFKSNIDNSNAFGYIIPTLGFDYKLSADGKLVFATVSKAHLTIGDEFEFYQAASLGTNEGLRGFRDERFTGKNSFYQSSDLRFNLRKRNTSILPIETGIYAGFDVGRVWVGNDLVIDPSFNQDRWNTSIGAGFFVNGADKLTGNISLFSSDDGLLFSFGIGFGF
jgi:hypothetical protein